MIEIERNILGIKLILFKKYGKVIKNDNEELKEYKEISKKFKPIKPKTDKDKELNRRNKILLEKEKESFKRYLIDNNEFLIITYLVLFHLQVSSPPYDVKTKDIFNLWDKKDIYNVKSLGFRGEALAAINSVSEVECMSRKRNSNNATKVSFSFVKSEIEAFLILKFNCIISSAESE